MKKSMKRKGAATFIITPSVKAPTTQSFSNNYCIKMPECGIISFLALLGENTLLRKQQAAVKTLNLKYPLSLYT